MERTDYVAKAKSLLKRAALVIVPLAMATTATAGLGTPTLPTGNTYCNVLGTSSSGAISGSCSMGVDPLLLPGLAGVKLYTNGWQTLVPYGSEPGPFDVNIEMRSSGPFFNFLPSTLPVFYDFTLETDSGVTIDSWALDFSLFGRYNGVVSFSGSGDGTFSGPGLLNLTHDSESTYLSLSASLRVNGEREGKGGVRLNVPQAGSFDFGAASSPVPEPATMGIAGAGLALLAWFGRRRNHQTS